MFEAFWQVSVTKDAEFALFAGSDHLNAALNYEHKSLRGGASQFPTGFEFSGVLGESRTQGRTDMHASDALPHARQGGAEKSSRGQQDMTVLDRTARTPKLMHGRSLARTRP